MVVAGFASGKRAAHGAPRSLKRPARSCGGDVSKREMRPDFVAVVTPKGQRPVGIGQAVGDFLAQAFVPQTAVETPEDAVLPGLAGVDVMPLVAIGLRPFSELPYRWTRCRSTSRSGRFTRPRSRTGASGSRVTPSPEWPGAAIGASSRGSCRRSRPECGTGATLRICRTQCPSTSVGSGAAHSSAICGHGRACGRVCGGPTAVRPHPADTASFGSS